METIINGSSIIKLTIGLEYLISLLLCIALIIHIKDAVSTDQIFYHRVFFICICITLIIILISRILHFNVRITDAVRLLAVDMGWYNARHGLQIMILCGVCVFGIMSVIIIDRIIRNTLSRYWFTLCSHISLVSYQLIKLISYHSVDQLLNRELGMIKISSVVEAICITWVAISLASAFIKSIKKKNAAITLPTTRYI